MAAKKNPLSDKAYELYKSGMKLVDIADQLGKPQGTIRRWKNTYNWDTERSESNSYKSERSECKKKEKKQHAYDGTRETLKNDELTPEQQMFCVYYSRSFNATQSYLKSFHCSYDTANAEGYKLLVKPCIKNEIERLKEIKRQQIVAGTDDIVELQMRIAFADIGDYTSFGREEVAIMGPFGPIKDPDTGEVLKKEVNAIRLNESGIVDTQLIQEVKQGRDGVSIKLADRQKAIDWLSKFFEMNPEDRHRKEFDKRKLELELLKIELKAKESKEEAAGEDNFLDALNQSAKEVWPDD